MRILEGGWRMKKQQCHLPHQNRETLLRTIELLRPASRFRFPLTAEFYAEEALAWKNKDRVTDHCGHWPCWVGSPLIKVTAEGRWQPSLGHRGQPRRKWGHPAGSEAGPRATQVDSGHWPPLCSPLTTLLELPSLAALAFSPFLGAPSPHNSGPLYTGFLSLLYPLPLIPCE